MPLNKDDVTCIHAYEHAHFLYEEDVGAAGSSKQHMYMD